MMPESEENHLDQSLRSKFDNFELTPGAPVWAGIEQRLTPPPQLRPRRWRPLLVPLLFVLTAFLAGLGGWLLPHGVAALRKKNQASITSSNSPQNVVQRSKTTISARQSPPRSAAAASSEQLSAFRSTRTPVSEERSLLRSSAIAKPEPQGLLQAYGPTVAARKIAFQKSGMAEPVLTIQTAQLQVDTAIAVSSNETPLAGKPAGISARNTVPSTDTTPATLRALATLEHQTLEQLPSVFTLAPGTPPAGSRATLVASLRGERAELLRLQRRADSLLLALGEVLPGAPQVAAAALVPPADTTLPQPLKHRWSLLLTATPEQNTLTLQGPENNPLTALRRNHETGRAGLNAALVAEYQLAPRLSVGGGVGFSTFGADLRITNKNTEISVRYDSTTTRTVTAYTSTSQTHSIRIIQVPQLSPVFNGSGQVIRYDTVYVPRQDTVFSTITQHDTVRTTRKVLTPLISRKETLSTKLLQPNYRFFTVPVLLRYRLAAPGTSRLWTDVALGAQLQFFLGGTQVVTDDGESFRTEKITVGSSPFRALNVALSGSLALNYALTSRLSVSVAPSLRWQALSLYKAETGLVQQPTSTGLMFGVRLGL